MLANLSPRIILIALVTGLPMAATCHVDAQVATNMPGGSSDRILDFRPDYFMQFQISTAMDMVSHLPGFGFNAGTSARGFAGTAGNVLIDGQRPATKADLGDILGNIPATQVDHIELIVGGAPGIDMQGYTQVANVVRKSDTKPSLIFESGLKLYAEDRKMPDFSLSYSANNHGHQTDISYSAFAYNDDSVNNEQRLTWTPDRIQDLVPQHLDLVKVAGGVGSNFKVSRSDPLWGGKISIDAVYTPTDYNLNADYRSQTTTTERLSSREIASELGLQYERGLMPGLTFDVNALDRHDRAHQNDVYRDTTLSDFQSVAISDEHILSGKLTWQTRDTLTLKFGVEHVLNGLDNLSSYTQNNTNQAVPFDKVQVEEDRTEYFTSANWQVRPKIALDASLRIESSTISVKQDHRSQSVTFAKPKVLIVWTPTDALKVSWRTEYYVGQLDFNDFASAVSLQTAVIKAGNPGIVPMTAWQNQITLDYRFWKKGSLQLSFEHADIQNVLDYAPITTSEGIFDARGNIGDGRRDSLYTSMTLPLDRFHIPNGEFRFNTSRNFTRVIDPNTRKERSISNRQAYIYDFSFDQTFPKSHASWGMDLSSVNDTWQFDATELYHYHSAPGFTIFANYKAPGNVTYSLTLQNPQGRHEAYDRYSWSGLRDLSPILLQQHTQGNSPPSFIFRIRKEM